MAKISFKKFEQKVVEDIKDISSKLGFTSIGEFSLVFKNEGNSSYFDNFFCATSSLKRERKFMFNVSGARKLYFLDKFIEPYLHLLVPFNKLNPNDPITFTFSLGDKFWRSTDTELSADNYNYEDLKERIQNLVSMVKQELDSMCDIRIMDRLANEKLNDSYIHPRNIGSGIYYHKMIIAKLAGNKMYEEIYKYFNYILEEDIKKQTRYSEKNKVHLIIVKQLYEDLKSVKPLENPGLI